MSGPGPERGRVPDLATREAVRSRSSGRACRMAGYLVHRDDHAIYDADPQGTWVLPHGSYDLLEDWAGGAKPPESLGASGKPVQLALREGALIHEIRPWRIRSGGDPHSNKLRREAMRKVFSLGDGTIPTTERTALGEAQLVMLEETVGRRLGWNPEQAVTDQSFRRHHPLAASWACGSDGGVI